MRTGQRRAGHRCSALRVRGIRVGRGHRFRWRCRPLRTYRGQL